MATIIIHAGMPKTGSTSVQRWIVDNSTRLRTDYGIQTVVARRPTDPNPTSDVRLEAYESGPVNSGLLIYTWIVHDRAPAIAQGFIEELAGFADSHRVVLVTAEALSQPFWRADEPFLSGLEQLARDHEVRVAYYVRPQHTAIEAWWRQDGYKRPLEPSIGVREQAEQLHYLQTMEAVARLAPHVDFGVRPYRNDLLDRGSTVQDFVQRFLEIDEVCPDIQRNAGLSLALVNILRHAPEGMFWAGGSEPYPREKVRAAFERLGIVEPAKLRRSRAILRQYCHERFETENQELIRTLRWDAEVFVPTATDDPGDWDLSELDALWAPDESPAELAAIYRALVAALE